MPDWFADLKPIYAAQESWRQGTYDRREIRHLVYPSTGPFSVACGAGMVAGWIRSGKFTPDLIERLYREKDARGQSRFDESFLNHLQRLTWRVDAAAAADGTVLLPGEPVAMLRGPALQLHLLEGMLELVWEASHWSTLAAQVAWASGDLHEDAAPYYEFLAADPALAIAFETLHDRHLRALFIGGAQPAQARQWLDMPARYPDLQVQPAPKAMALSQIRRLFEGQRPVADVWLMAAQEASASITRPEAVLYDRRAQRQVTVRMTRFQKLYHPLLVQGRPVWESTHPEYGRQRTLQHLAAFAEGMDWEAYPYGYLVD
jgi:hypothetical protein